MSYQLKISQLRRKRVAAFMLINFLFSTVLVAFPLSKCDGMCSIEVESHHCSDMKEMTCCEMMDMINSNSIPFEMEITENSCDYMIDVIDEINFLVPKIVDTNIALSETKYNTNKEVEETPDFFVKPQNTLLNSSPPIYLSISSFLI